MAAGQLMLLLWKNFILLKRRPKQILVIIIVPVIAAGLLWLTRRSLEFDRTNRYGAIVFPPFTVDNLESDALSYGLMSRIGQTDIGLEGFSSFHKPKLELHYTPDTDLTKEILDRVKEKLGINIKGITLFPKMSLTLPYHMAI